MNKKTHEYYLKKELYDLIKTDSSLFEFIQEGTLDGLWYWNLENIEDEWMSPRFWEVLGYNPKEKKHDPSEWQEIIFEDDLEEAKKNLKKHCEDPKHPYDQTVRYRHKDGSIIWIRCRGIAIRDKSGKAIRMLGAHTNITDVKEKEESLKESESRFRTTVQSLDAGVVIHMSNGSIIDSNKRASEILGLTRNQLLDKTNTDPIWNFVNEDVETLSIEEYPINLVLANNKPIKNLIIGVIQSSNNDIIWAKVNAIPIFDSSGDISEVVVSFIDVTEMNNTNKKLKKSEKKYHTLHDTMIQGVVYQDKEGYILSCNPAAEKILGLSLSQMQGKTSMDPRWKMIDEKGNTIPGEKHPSMMTLKTKEKVGPVVRGVYHPENDAYVWLNIIAIPLFNKGEDTPYQVYATLEDITNKKHAEENLTFQHELMNYIIQYMNTGVAVHDKELNYLYVSDKYKSQYNVDEDIIGKHHYDVFPDLPEKWRKVHQRSLQGEVISADRDKFVHEDGHVDWTRWESRPWYEENGNIGGIIIYTQVINTYIEKEQKLKEVNENLRERKAMIEGLFNNMKSGVAIYKVINEGLTGEDYIIKDFNDISLLWENKTRNEVVGKPIIELHPNVEKSGIIDTFRKVWQTGEATTHPIVQFVNGGYNRWHENTIFKLPTGEIVAMYTDVTERVHNQEKLKKSNEKLKQSEEQYRLLTTKMQLGLALNEIICDDNGNPIDFRFISVNKSWEKLMGVKKEDVLGKTVLEVFPDTEKSWIEIFGKVALTRESTKFEDYATELGKYLSMSIYSPKEGQFATVVENITEKQKQEDLIDYSLKHDSLTGIPNRYFFNEKLIELDNKKNYPLAILMMDINGLKLINDSFGQDAGNTVLKQFSDILSEEKDKSFFIARVSGDEFIMLCPQTSSENIIQIKQRLSDKISKQRINNIEYSVAIGFAIKEKQDQEISEIVIDAENAMYKNKIVYGEGTRSAAIESVFATLTNKYEYERIHSERVAKYSKLIGQYLDLRQDEVDELELAGRLHDIGKISISDEVLMKPGKLTAEEWKKIKDHTVIGYQILKAADKYSNLADYALSHHERIDGNGYPNGIVGKDIPLFAKVISVADSYEAMTSNRVYRKSLNKEQAIQELKEHSGTQFSAEIVDIFIHKVLVNELV